MKILVHLIACLCLMLVTSVGVFAQNRVLQPNDKVRVVCEEEPSLNQDYSLTRDGLIVMNFIGAVKVSGLTESKAADRIEEELVKQRIVRRATVTVTLLASENLPVRYSGAVKKPGETIWRDDLRLADIARLAEPERTADMERVRIESRLGVISIVNFKKYDGKDNTFNPLIKPGDFVFFQIALRQTEVVVIGSVKKPGAIELKPNMTAAMAIEQAGGLLSNANPDRIRLERANQPDQILSIRNESALTLLKSGDRIMVEQVAKKDVVLILGGVKNPGTIGWYSGMTVTQAIRGTGGLMDGIKPQKVKIIRRTGEKVKTITVDYPKILGGFIGDVSLEAGDRLEVPGPKRRSAGEDLLPLAGILIFLFVRG
jgi:protein involved in polysaccharide export with SLBB domain